MSNQNSQNIAGALEEIYEARLALTVLGNLVDRYETDDISFSIVGCGALIVNQTERIVNALETLEEDYNVGELEDQIVELKEKERQKIHKEGERSDKVMEVFNKHKKRAELEIADKGLNYITSKLWGPGASGLSYGGRHG